MTSSSHHQEETEIEAESATSKILRLASKSYLLVFCGKHLEEYKASPMNRDCCVYTEPTLEAITTLFDELYSVQQSSSSSVPSLQEVASVRGIHFVDYAFPQLPNNIGRVFTNIKLCSFVNCINLQSLSSTVTQFTGLQSLSLRDCPSLTTLSSLKDIPRQMNLQALRINNCGLKVTPTDDWGDAMMALGNTSNAGTTTSTSRSVLVLNITSCHELKCIPSTITYLKDILSCLRLESNNNLSILPQELGDLRSMTEFQLINCPSIKNLPSTMSRLRDCCQVSITNNDCLIDKISNDTKKQHQQQQQQQQHSHHYRALMTKFYYSQKIIFMERYFQQSRVRNFRGVVRLSTLVRRAKFRAVDRIYRPGGEGFMRCRDNFRRTVNATTRGLSLKEVVNGNNVSVGVDVGLGLGGVKVGLDLENLDEQVDAAAALLEQERLF